MRSALGTMPRPGVVFHAAVVAGSLNAIADSGRCDSAGTRAFSGASPAANTSGKESMAADKSVPGSAPATGYGAYTRRAAGTASGKPPLSLAVFERSTPVVPAHHGNI
ncbi:hypothetical protein [Nocardia aurea]|uniref:Uncharacterized protein n=1 Tax=Nocardia aurea TaxID=2144174 RepID=A0ABV3FLB5_9NOCA